MLDKKLLIELQEYVESHLNRDALYICESPVYSEKVICKEMMPTGLEDFIKNNQKPSFNQMLFSFIDKKGFSEIELYKRAGIDRKHFSKIRSNSDYHPGKSTIISLALALELNKEETDELLSTAGFSLSDSDTFDLVIQFCIKKRIYDIYNVNQALENYSLKSLV